MDIFLIIGVITGLLSIVVGMIVKGADVTILLNPAAAIIILVGTAAAVVNSFPKKEILNIGKIFGVLFKEKQDQDPVEIIKSLVEMSQNTRKNGLLSLETTVQGLENQFMKKGLEMVVDGVEPDYIREVLETEIESVEERHRAGASIFTAAGGASPTLGVLGAVIGLIGALGNLNDTEKLAHMIAAAFVATLYGIFFGYVIFHPFASRLKRKSAVEIGNMNIMLEGILGIQSGANPKNIETKLKSMLEPKEKLRIEEQGSKEN
ncbi:flagellar motor stator protein MotA [Clostridium sp. SHJSY1]|uniref:flagellar motor stator protein MotA n=1 Tax=Clostridium sp. SHJSY1 TaxID=2942483 RepID=UPI002873FA7B|nr:flagellar motor stator protein MotA [Clostridium sp. SHJSY1]MDS0528278.1 flagellar motor stator protein MotA [Clostridium sp. SHJSY1]